MPMTCRICADPKRKEFDELLIAGRSPLSVAAQFGFSKSSAYRHRDACLKRLLTKANRSRPAELRRGDQLLEKLDRLLKEALAVAHRAKRDRNDPLLLKALNEARATVATMGEFTGAKYEPPPVQNTNYILVFEGGRPVMRKSAAEAIEIPALPPSDESTVAIAATETGRREPQEESVDQ